MIYEERDYSIKVGQINNYLRMYEEEGFAIQLPILGNLIGYFTTETGSLNRTVHIWQYQDFSDRIKRRKLLWESEAWNSYFAKVAPLIIEQNTRILIPTKFSPL